MPAVLGLGAPLNLRKRPARTGGRGRMSARYGARTRWRTVMPPMRVLLPLLQGCVCVGGVQAHSRGMQGAVRARARRKCGLEGAGGLGAWCVLALALGLALALRAGQCWPAARLVAALVVGAGR